MGIFWPSDVKSEPNAVARAGRVLHWTFLGFAVVWLGLAALIVAEGGADSGYPVILIPFAAISAAIGRGLRYILAGE